MYSLVLVDYNSLGKTIEYALLCRKHLGEAGASHVVIVENGTPEKPMELLTAAFGDPELRECPQVERTIYSFQKDGQQILYCDSGANLGYAKGNNLGVKIADAIWNDPVYIISNNDLVFSRELDLSVADCLFAECPEIGVVGPLVVTPAGEQQSPRRWQSPFHRLIANYWVHAFGGLFGRETGKRLWEKYCNDTVRDAQSGYCDWVSGCFMFVRAESFRKAGLFDEHTFLYAEEMILAKRLEAVGSRVYFCRELEVIHNHAQTTKKALAALRIAEIDFKANYYFYKTYEHTSPVLLGLAKGSFWLYCTLFKAKQLVKRWLRKEG